MFKPKICVVTGTRADYGLLRYLINLISNSDDLQLQLIVTGMHLSPEFGLTSSEIKLDRIHIDRNIEMLLSSDTPVGISKSLGLGIIGFADAFADLQPDFLVVLGDRFEAFAAASAALVARIPIAHLHGGELTEGAFDDSLRHSITKMSNLHFVAAEEYRQRVIQMGEQPECVYLVGGFGVDAIKRIKLLTLDSLQSELNFKLGPRNLLVTFHSVTREDNTSGGQMKELLCALDELKHTHLVFTMPNADTNSRVLIQLIEDFCSSRPYAKAFYSLGHIRYFSCIRLFDGVVGNSSSGLTEVPSFKKGTVNIGDRQKGRLKADSVIDCEPNRKSILDALNKLFQPEFQKVVASCRNPYGEGQASVKTIGILRECLFGLSSFEKKAFYQSKP